jgi:hypothetical protein
VRPVRLDRAFTVLAERAGALSAQPEPDGSVLLRYRAQSSDAELRWDFSARDEGLELPGFQGRVMADGLQGEALRTALDSLGRALHSLTGGELDPFAIRLDADAPLRLDPRFVEDHLALFLRAELSSWGPLIYKGAEQRVSALGLVFEGSVGRVVFELFPATSGQRHWIAIGPMAIRIAEDNRPDRVRHRADAHVDHYLAYALSRSVAPGQPLVSVPEADATASKPAAGSAAVILPTPDQIPDHLDQTPAEAFFHADAERQMGCHEQIATLLNSDPGVALVFHLFDECTTKYAWLGSTQYMHNMHVYSRFTPLPIRMASGRANLLEVDQFQAITGCEDALRQQVLQVAAQDDTRLVVLAGTCVGTCTGMDLEGLAAELEQETGLRVAVLNLTIDDYTPVPTFWEELFGLARTDLAPEPGGVNLVGYCPEGADFAREFERVLQLHDLHLLGTYVPSFRSDRAERFFEAQCSLVNTAEFSRREFSAARERLTGARFVDLRPPVGRAASLAFYQKALEALDISDAHGAAAQAWEPFRTDWDRYRQRARDHRAALVVGPQDVRYLLEPELLYGIDLLGLLTDMGFGIHLIATSGGLDQGAERVTQALQTRLEALDTEPGRGPTVETLALGEPLTPVLRACPASLVFTEYPPDQRILTAGKAAIHPRTFELGLAGAVQSIARLVRLAEGRIRSWTLPSQAAKVSP